MRDRRRTTRLAEVEADEDADDTADYQHEAQEVEFVVVLSERLAVMRVQVQEEPQDEERNASGRSTNLLDEFTEVGRNIGPYRLMKKHLESANCQPAHLKRLSRSTYHRHET